MAKGFLIGIFIVVIIAVIIGIVMSSLGGVSLATSTATVTGETGAWLNETTYTVDTSGANDFAALTITSAINWTDGTAILTPNFTVSGTGFTNASATTWANVSINYTYTYSNEIGDITDYGSNSTATFMSNATTWMSLLSVAIIMMIIAIVLVVVGRFGGRPTV